MKNLILAVVLASLCPAQAPQVPIKWDGRFNFTFSGNVPARLAAFSNALKANLFASTNLLAKRGVVVANKQLVYLPGNWDIQVVLARTDGTEDCSVTISVFEGWSLDHQLPVGIFSRNYPIKSGASAAQMSKNIWSDVENFLGKYVPPPGAPTVTTAPTGPRRTLPITPPKQGNL